MITDTARLEQLCENGLKALGYELVDLEFLRDQLGWVLRVFIDHPYEPTAKESAINKQEEGTAQKDRADLYLKQTSVINLRDCELASQHLGTVLDVEDLIPMQYRLEVSSPGINRPLKKERDFVRFIGHRVKIQMREPIDGRKNFLGCLCSAGNGQIVMEIDKQVFHLPICDIHKARLEVDFSKLAPTRGCAV